MSGVTFTFLELITFRTPAGQYFFFRFPAHVLIWTEKLPTERAAMRSVDPASACESIEGFVERFFAESERAIVHRGM